MQEKGLRSLSTNPNPKIIVELANGTLQWIYKQQIVDIKPMSGKRNGGPVVELNNGATYYLSEAETPTPLYEFWQGGFNEHFS